jgi:hypothetical protein
MEAEIGFSWWRERNPRDYEEINADAPFPSSFVDEIRDDKGHRIVAKGVRLEAYRPIDEFPDLFQLYAKVRSQEDAVKFVRTFGPLTEEGLPGRKGDDVQKVLVLAQAMAAGRLGGEFGLPVCSLNARLVAEHDGIHLRVEPTNLLEALWFQFADAVKRGQASRCRQCKTLFTTGPDAKRRRGAEFCSIECKTKFHSLKRSR